MKQPEPLIGGTRAVAEKARDAVTDVASTAKSVAREQVEGRAEETKERAVSGLGDVAGALRRTGDATDNDVLSDYVTRAADGIEQVTTYFREKNVGEIVTDVERFARREPALFIGGAFALGLLGARFLKSSSRVELDEDDFVATSPTYSAPRAAIPRPTPMRETPRPMDPIGATPSYAQQALRPNTVDPYPQQHTGVKDPTLNKIGGGSGGTGGTGGEGSGSL